MRRRLTLVVPFALYLLGVLLLGDWIIDDAGISFAYARNLAEGHGLVSQPGRPPVEGFSNFLWVIVLVPLHVLHVFDPVYAPKVLGALLVLVALVVIRRAMRSEKGSDLAGFLAIGLIALAPPVVIWTASGLENSLTALLVATLWATSVEQPQRWRERTGALAALLGMTHPGGLIFVGLGPALALVSAVRKKPVRRIAKDLASFTLGAGAVLVPFFAVRLGVFGRILPHTYYAKRVHATFGDRLAALAADPNAVLSKLASISSGALGPPGPLLVALTFACAIALAIRGKLTRSAAMATLLLSLALMGYVFIDDDWMGEHRFGTAAVVLAIIALSATGSAALSAFFPAERPEARLPLTLICTALIVAFAAMSAPRTIAFAQNPPTTFGDVDRSMRKKFDAYEKTLGLRQASVLLPDVGAMLYGSQLSVIDSAGLCEPSVIHTLKNDGPVWLNTHPAFYDLVFDELRPTFISTHHFWTLVAAFDIDPRFARDYVAINAYDDEYVLRVFGRRLRSGDFVRRDALADPTALERLRTNYHPPLRPDPLVVRIGEALRSFGRSNSALRRDELRALANDALTTRNDPNRAATLYGRLLDQDPSDLEATALRARALDSAVRPDEARALWTRVSKLASPGSPQLAALSQMRLAGLPLMMPVP